ncbi:MAG: VOC family protein [Planctomycetota bacterium]
MSDSQELVHHQINYIELPALDLEAAKRFYQAAFDWSFNDYGPQYMGIKKQDSDGEIGGICLAESVAKGGPLVILYSRDLESSLQSVKQAGGEISLEIISFPGGRRFQFLDPSGNELGVWSDQPAP